MLTRVFRPTRRSFQSSCELGVLAVNAVWMNDSPSSFAAGDMITFLS